MARCPFATWRPLTENETQGGIYPTQFILHTAVDAPPSNSSLWGYFERSDVTVESHFFIKLGGIIEQYMDTSVRADANYTANVRAISVETEDDGTLQPWTPAQLDAIKRLGDWVMAVHPAVARQVCPAHDQPGWGYHSMWGAPSPWTPAAGKTCPGAPRIAQFHSDLTPWLAAPSTPKDWFDMATQQELEDVVRRLGPWIGIVSGDPSQAVFIFDGGTRTWVGSQEAVRLQKDVFGNVHTNNGDLFTPSPEEAKGFHLVNRAELEEHLGAPYEF